MFLAIQMFLAIPHDLTVPAPGPYRKVPKGQEEALCVALSQSKTAGNLDEHKWLTENFVGCTASLFEAAALVVTTFNYGRRKTLRRHPDFDHLMIKKWSGACGSPLGRAS